MMDQYGPNTYFEATMIISVMKRELKDARENALNEAIAACAKRCKIWRDENPDIILTTYEAIANILISDIQALKRDGRQP